ncbi:LANO_0H04302g1_1 [Lachancea nothofagi CBS 11611]|uniref:NAD(P)H-hydrate epimerase n=1 Tax=Lachancea nothofagi CBS 11611 TaxID=1266666 RepID=A0A1G4KLD2_9SACH|nr:LANO_0H04302g1_1 [Lachancea nothofagi CBS 11611]
MSFKTISSQLAAQLDKDLMGPEIGFTLEQLMELAGLSVAEAVLKEFPYSKSRKSQVLVVAGPGNNGGDGLVCARHLALFGFNPVVFYPKRSSRTQFYGQLVNQLKFFQIPVLDGDDDWAQYLNPNETLCVVDAIFGFSFKPPVREPFGSILQQLRQVQDQLPIVSVDIPTGWDVDEGPVEPNCIIPKVLVSLTVPKPCARKIESLETQHYVGGRFVPRSFANKYGFEPFAYENASQVVKLAPE